MRHRIADRTVAAFIGDAEVQVDLDHEPYRPATRDSPEEPWRIDITRVCYRDRDITDVLTAQATDELHGQIANQWTNTDGLTGTDAHFLQERRHDGTNDDRIR